jgi:ribonuclease HII
MAATTAPSFELEDHLVATYQGSALRPAGESMRIVGIDEVGRGAWAGPLVVGVAVLPLEPAVRTENDVFAELRDSKTLTERRRESIFTRLAPVCHWALGIVAPSECDRLGMSAAQRLATERALGSLAHASGIEPEIAIGDGSWDFISPLVPVVEMRVKADRSSMSVAAASILAKVSRDQMMRDAAESYPAWSFDTNKGYPCWRHRTTLRGYGPSAIHRRSWSFMDQQPWSGVVRQPSER